MRARYWSLLGGLWLVGLSLAYAFGGLALGAWFQAGLALAGLVAAVAAAMGARWGLRAAVAIHGAWAALFVYWGFSAGIADYTPVSTRACYKKDCSHRDPSEDESWILAVTFAPASALGAGLCALGLRARRRERLSGSLGSHHP